MLLVVIGIVGFFYMRKKLLREGAADAPAVSSEVNFSETKKSSEDGTVIAPKKAETENRMIVDAVWFHSQIQLIIFFIINIFLIFCYYFQWKFIKLSILFDISDIQFVFFSFILEKKDDSSS